MSQVLFSSFQFKFAQYFTWVMNNIAKHTKKKMLNIFCIVYLFVVIFYYCVLRVIYSICNEPRQGEIVAT